MHQPRLYQKDVRIVLALAAPVLEVCQSLDQSSYHVLPAVRARA